MNADQFANWTKEKPCECSKENYFTTSLTLEEVPMSSGDVEILLTHWRLAWNQFTEGFYYKHLNIGDITHEAVQIKFKCDSCAREFHQTYDLAMQVQGIRKRWGYYGERRNERCYSTKRFSFEHVEECYAQMSGKYDQISRNCANWVREFYAKVTEYLCTCSGSPDNYSTTSLRLVRVKQSPSSMHHAVQVTFKCDSCGPQFRRIYELFEFENGDGNGKAAVWHYYTESEIDKVIRTSIRSISFAHLQACFDAMWLKFNFHRANCGDWALELWDKVFEIKRQIIYEERLNTWDREINAYENSQEKKARDAKHRELFEKTFIELKEMRKEKERNSRVKRSRISLTPGPGGNGIATPLPSTSTQIQINDQNKADLGQVELEKAYQAAALVPPLFSNPPRKFFDNRNGLVDSSLAVTQKQLKISQTVWTDTERAVFTEKITLYPKNFAAVAAFLPTKTVKECVEFYYMTKKQNNYKQTFPQRKKTGRRRYRPPIMPPVGDTNIQSSEKDSMAKLTTRPLQFQKGKSNKREQQPLPLRPYHHEENQQKCHRPATGDWLMTRQMLKNQQIQQQKSQQIVAAAEAAANHSLGYADISAAAAKLTTTEPAAKRQKQQMGTTTSTSTILSQGKPAKMPSATHAISISESQQPQKQQICEICDSHATDKDQYRIHLQQAHKQLLGKTASDMIQGAPLACSRCRERFWTYEGLERHLVMSHGLVTSDLLAKAQRNQDSGRCKLCGKSYDFSILQHLVTVHQVKLCSAQIMYSCNSKIAKRPYPHPQQQEQSSSNQLPTSSTICQPPAPPEKKKKRIDEEAINILAKAQGLKKLDSFSNEQRNNILKMFFEKLNYEYINEDFVQALYQFSIKQRKQIVQTSAGSEHRNNE